VYRSPRSEDDAVTRQMALYLTSLVKRKRTITYSWALGLLGLSGKHKEVSRGEKNDQVRS